MSYLWNDKKILYQEVEIMITFEYEYFTKQETIRDWIKDCEGSHTQQAIYSTYHDALTQVCFDCKRIRSTIKR